MKPITNLLIFLIVISMFLPTSAIMYASGQTNDNSGSSTTGGGSTDNSATLPTTSTGNNNTENTPDLINSILTVHNNERAAVGAPPLVWSNDLASGAKTWADHLATTGEFAHDPVYIGAESIAGYDPSGGISAPDNGQSRWVNEKNNWNGGTYPSGECASGKVCGHYMLMVGKGETQVGCGTAIGNKFSWSPGYPAGVLVCRYR